MHKSNKGACKFMAHSVRVRVLEVEVDEERDDENASVK